MLTKLPMPPKWLRELSGRNVPVQPVRSRRKSEYDVEVDRIRESWKRLGKTQNLKKIRHALNRTMPSYGGSDKAVA